MPKTYTFTLGEEDAGILHGNLQYDKDTLRERDLELDESNTSDALEMEANAQAGRVADILIRQYEDQKTIGPMVGIDIRLDLAEPLQMALYAQWSFAKQKLARYLTMVANPMVPADAADLLHLEIKQYIRQIEALEVVMRQVGRHV